jgi:hypothetical protein
MSVLSFLIKKIKLNITIGIKNKKITNKNSKCFANIIIRIIDTRIIVINPNKIPIFIDNFLLIILLILPVIIPKITPLIIGKINIIKNIL